MEQVKEEVEKAISKKKALKTIKKCTTKNVNGKVITTITYEEEK